MNRNILILLLLVFYPTLVCAQGPSAGVSGRDQESVSARTGTDREKSMETRRGNEERDTRSREHIVAEESARGSSIQSEEAETNTSTVTVEQRLDVAVLIAQAMARAERMPMEGRYARDIASFRLFSGPEFAVVVKFGDAVYGTTTYSPEAPDAVFRRPGENDGFMQPRSVGSHYPMPINLDSAHGKIALAWILYGEIARAAMGHFPSEAAAFSAATEGGEIVLASIASAEKAAQAAVQRALLDPSIRDRVREKWQYIHACSPPTEKAYFLAGETTMKCGPLQIDFRGKSATWQGAQYISSSGILGGSTTVAIASASSSSSRVATSESENERSTQTHSAKTAQEQASSSSSSASMRRSTSTGQSRESSTSSEAQAGVSVSPQ